MDVDPNSGNEQINTEFRTDGGKVGGYFADIPLLLLTTTGAKTGVRRTRPLAYLADGDRYIVAAGAGGAPTHPAWYHTLIAHPTVTVEVGTNTFEATAIVAAGQERDALFEQFVAQEPQLAAYQARTTRQIPVITLTRTDRPPTDPG